LKVEYLESITVVLLDFFLAEELVDKTALRLVALKALLKVYGKVALKVT
jgi:hypothetical protein